MEKQKPSAVVKFKTIRSTRNTLLNKKAIADRVHQVAKEIEDYPESDLTIVSVLSGAFRFTSDLMKSIERKSLRIKFVEIESYGDGTKPTSFRLGSLSERDIFNQHVIVVDDVLDTGRTLNRIVKLIEIFEPKSVTTCVLLVKKKIRNPDIQPTIIGFEIPDVFVVGYGMDRAGLFRELSFIADGRDIA